MLDSLPAHDLDSRAAHYEEVLLRMGGLLEDEHDWIVAMATVSCELHHAFAHYHWTGFYRAVTDELLAIGPYQGSHGCLRIPFSQGVCGAAARQRETQLVADVHAFAGHIACSSSTASEIVVPIMRHDGRVLAVLDVDSDLPNAFTDIDRAALETLALRLGAQFGG